MQYCPDSAKAESANVGVVLLCPDAHFCGVLIGSGNDRVRRFFGVSGSDLERFTEIKEAFTRRFENDRSQISNLEQLEHFRQTRANKLLLTEPRNVRVGEPSAQLELLFKELVGGRFAGQRRVSEGRGLSVRPQLRKLFSRREIQDKLLHKLCVESRFGTLFEVPYAFRNGKLNLVVPQTIHADSDKTYREAEILAFRGIQLQKFGYRDEKTELIVPLPDPEDRFGPVTQAVADQLKDNGIRTVFESELETLGAEIIAHGRR